MGTFAETAIVDYRLSFADQGKQTSVFRFAASNKRKYAVSVFRLQETNGSVPFSICLYLYIRKTELYNYIPIYLLTKKQTEIIRLQTDLPICALQ
jgi:hypothetical protein